MKSFILAARPKTLLAGVIPPLMMIPLGYHLGYEVNPVLPVYCALIALLLQVATNFFNDAIDFETGVDVSAQRADRLSTQGHVSSSTLKKWALLTLSMTAVLVVDLCLRVGYEILPLAMLCMYLTYGYTGGPLPLAYKGLGEIFVFLFFGLVLVMGTSWVSFQLIPMESFILGVQYGLLSCALIAINNDRDRITDKESHKMTLATRMSKRTYRSLIALFLLFPLALGVALDQGQWRQLALIPLAFMILKKIEKEPNKALKWAGLNLFFFSALVMKGWDL